MRDFRGLEKLSELIDDTSLRVLKVFQQGHHLLVFPPQPNCPLCTGDENDRFLPEWNPAQDDLDTLWSQWGDIQAPQQHRTQRRGGNGETREPETERDEGSEDLPSTAGTSGMMRRADAVIGVRESTAGRAHSGSGASSNTIVNARVDDGEDRHAHEASRVWLEIDVTARVLPFPAVINQSWGRRRWALM